MALLCTQMCRLSRHLLSSYLLLRKDCMSWVTWEHKARVSDSHGESAEGTGCLYKHASWIWIAPEKRSSANSERHVLMPMNASGLPNTYVACPSTSLAKESPGLSSETHRLSAFTSLAEIWSRISDSRGHTITTTAEPLDAHDVLQERRKHSKQKKNQVLAAISWPILAVLLHCGQGNYTIYLYFTILSMGRETVVALRVGFSKLF